MTSYLIDLNVWLALSWRLHPNSAAAHQWLAALPPAKTRLLFCRITQLGLLRLLTSKMVMGDSTLNIAEAFATFDRWSEDPRVEFANEPRGLEATFRRISAALAKQAATKAIMDAYLAALAESERATLVTADRALGAIARRRRAPHVVISVEQLRQA